MYVYLSIYMYIYICIYIYILLCENDQFNPLSCWDAHAVLTERCWIDLGSLKDPLEVLLIIHQVHSPL